MHVDGRCGVGMRWTEEVSFAYLHAAAGLAHRPNGRALDCVAAQRAQHQGQLSALQASRTVYRYARAVKR